jgi:hypothetical protein
MIQKFFIFFVWNFLLKKFSKLKKTKKKKKKNKESDEYKISNATQSSTNP